MHFGQLKRVIGLTLDTSPITNSSKPATVIFDVIHSLNITRQHPCLDIHFAVAGSRTFGATEVMDLTCVQCVVGCVPDCKEVAVIDRSGALLRALFVHDS
jgi:hypothetical protein